MSAQGGEENRAPNPQGGPENSSAGEPLLPRRQIHVLPEGVANRIAAGEVVERPASVVKELIENALDAEATVIQVGVKRAGLDEILLADNGHGMDGEEMLLALRRHATSKIRTGEDLQRILQLGFRGEALPSIASVSRMEILSRREDREAGARLTIAGGELKAPEPAARERGTTMRVRSLFYNVPARRKFLRTPATEYGHVAKVFKRYALAYPDLEWQLLKDDEVVHDLVGGTLKQRITDLFGEHVQEDLHDVEGRSGDVFVGGVVGGKSLFRRSRGDQFLFINRRPFESGALHHAVVNGFGPLIERGQVPFYVLNLRLDPEDFDVNVHPAKHEVRFKDDGQVYRAVLVAVRNALGLALKSGDSPVRTAFGQRQDPYEERSAGRMDGRRELELLFGRPERPGNGGPSGRSESELPKEPTPSRPIASVPPPPPKPTRPHDRRTGPEEGQQPAMRHEPPSGGAGPGGEAPGGESAAAPAEGRKLGHGERLNVWQVHRTYIFSQTKSGLVIIDQHVAHERILFERALAAMHDRPWSGQHLLFPISVQLTSEDSELLKEIAAGLSRMGFEIEPFGGTDWIIRSVPAGVKITNEEKLLREVLADYRQEHKIRLAPEESLAASFACKAAIKAGDPLGLQEMNALIDELFATEYPFVCPHGRPIVVNLTLSELHRLFDRPA